MIVFLTFDSLYIIKFYKRERKNFFFDHILILGGGNEKKA